MGKGFSRILLECCALNKMPSAVKALDMFITEFRLRMKIPNIYPGSI